jgi:hypothetical protein
METADPIPNPFALLMTPDAVLAAVDGSDGLRRLTSRICRPLDERQAKPPNNEVGTFDEAMDRRSRRQIAWAN